MDATHHITFLVLIQAPRQIRLNFTPHLALSQCRRNDHTDPAASRDSRARHIQKGTIKGLHETVQLAEIQALLGACLMKGNHEHNTPSEYPAIEKTAATRDDIQTSRAAMCKSSGCQVA